MSGGHPVATILFSVVAVVLFIANTALAFFGKSDTAIAAGYGTGVFCLIFAFLARFRRFKGFGIEAELWEQKQEEAAKLIETLKALVVLIAKHVVTLSAVSGRLQSPSRRDVFDFVNQVDDLVRSVGASEKDVAAIKSPYYYFTSVDLAACIQQKFFDFLDRKGRDLSKEINTISDAERAGKSTNEDIERKAKLLQARADITSYKNEFWNKNVVGKIGNLQGVMSYLDAIEKCPYLTKEEQNALSEEIREEVADLIAWAEEHKIRRPGIWFQQTN